MPTNKSLSLQIMCVNSGRLCSYVGRRIGLNDEFHLTAQISHCVPFKFGHPSIICLNLAPFHIFEHFNILKLHTHDNITLFKGCFVLIRAVQYTE